MQSSEDFLKFEGFRGRRMDLSENFLKFEGFRGCRMGPSQGENLKAFYMASSPRGEGNEPFHALT